MRRLPSVETLGSVTVICSDKTGTLTRNEITVQEIVAGGISYRVTGTGYDLKRKFYRLGDDMTGDAPSVVPRDEELVDVTDETDLCLALQIAVWCNNARLVPHSEASETSDIVGDPTEAALLVAGAKAGIDARHHGGSILWELPLDSARREMSVAVRHADGQRLLYTKGAPEAVLDKSVAERRSGRISPLTPERRAMILEKSSQMAGRAVRIMALASRPDPPDHGHHSAETDLVFVGLVGMLDPPRDEARAAVATCRDAGIRSLATTPRRRWPWLASWACSPPTHKSCPERRWNL